MPSFPNDAKEFVTREKLFYDRILAFLNPKFGYASWSSAQLLAIEFALRIQRQAEAAAAIGFAALDQETWAYLRVPLEHLVHQLYILFGGPKAEGRTADSLADQFRAYEAVDRLRLQKVDLKFARKRAYGRGLSKAEFEKELLALQNTVDNLPFEFGDTSWHERSSQAMFDAVRKHFPTDLVTFPMHKLWDIGYNVFRVQSSRLHPNWAGHRSLVKDEAGKRWLVDNRKVDEVWISSAMLIAHVSWCAVGKSTGTLPTIKALWKQEIDQGR